MKSAQNQKYKESKQADSKCYWIKKQIELFRIHTWIVYNR